jgi:hypothetical protein
VNIQTPGLQFYVDKLRNGERFSFTRYGNGEWDCILGLYYRTRSGSQRFSPDLQAALAKTLLEHRGGSSYPAIQSTGYLERLGLMPKAERWLAENRLDFDWHGGEVFHYASRKGQFYPFVEALRMHRVVVVGPAHLMSLPFATVFVPVRKNDCWQDVKTIEREVRRYNNAVVLFSAGPTAKVLIHRLYPEIGGSCWLLDMGSLWDPYCGVNSRKYHSSMTRDVIRRNLEGK